MLKIIGIYLLIINVVTFALYGIDKWYFKYTVPAMLVVHVVGMILLVVKL